MLPRDVETTEIETRYGVMAIFPHDDPIGLAVSSYGEWAQHEIDTLKVFLEPGDVALDVGSNIGTHSLAFARHVGPSGKVIAFEPQPQVIKLLRRTLQRNGISWVETRQAGVGDKPGELTLPAVDYSAHVNVGAVALDQSGDLEGPKVPIERLDDLNLSRCALVKVDAEGMGHLVLDGMHKLIDACRPTVAFEVNAIDEAILLLSRWKVDGYGKFLLRTPVFNESNFRKCSENIFGFAAETMLVFVPVERSNIVSSIQLPKQMIPISEYETLASELLLTPRFGDELRFGDDVGYKLVFEKLKDKLDSYRQEIHRYHQSNVLALKQLNYQIVRAAQDRIEVPFSEPEKTVFDPLPSPDDANQDYVEERAIQASDAANLVEATTMPNAAVSATKPRSPEPPAKEAEGSLPSASLISKFFNNRNMKLELIDASDFFDAAFYARQMPEIPKDRFLAIKHYLKRGAKLGLDPCSEFSTVGYLKLHPDVELANQNPLVHFLSSGQREGRAFYYSQDYKILEQIGLEKKVSSERLSSLQIDQIDASSLLDEHFYQSQLQEPLGSRRAMALHYAYAGCDQGLDPCETFSSEGYITLRPGSVAPGSNPLLHYITFGANEDRPLLNSKDFQLVKELGLVEEAVNYAGPTYLTSAVFDSLDRSTWFDERFYANQASLTEEHRRRCVVHYVLRGWKEGLDPTPAFSTNGFLRLYDNIRQANYCPLVCFLAAKEDSRPPVFNCADYNAIKHIEVVDERLLRETAVLIGAKEFNAAYYIEEAKLSSQNARHAAAHYLLEGWKKLLDPSPLFSTVDYLETHLELAAADDINPLLHYVLYGKKEGEVATTVQERRDKLSKRHKEVAPDHSKWDALQLAGGVTADNPVCDVIVPVYRGYAETMACLYSVLANPQQTPFRLLVVNDCSPEPELAAALRDLAAQGLICLIDLPSNRGFVGAVNAGMSANPDRDVILLNSDAEVFGSWLDRMYEILRSDGNIATITPFSNNATICSYPYPGEDYDQAFEMSDAELDALAAQVNRGQVVDIPTGVGFCMFIRRDALHEVGLFDEDRFGRGYGEENDFCRRAIAKGWRNVLAPNIFVRHYGSVSFGFEKHAQIRKSQAIISELYPSYNDEVAQFFISDPTLKYRRNLDVARLKKHSNGEAMLYVSHRWGGGTERHIRDLAYSLEQSGTPVFICRETSDPKNGVKTKEISISRLTSAPYPNSPTYNVDEEADAFCSALASLGIRYIHIHQLVGMSPFAVEFFKEVIEKSGLPAFITLHDYYSVCPRINFVDESKTYCGEPTIKVCESCSKDIMRTGGFSVHGWRKSFEELLLSVKKVFVPNEDVAARMASYFPQVPFSVKPHAVIIDEISPNNIPSKKSHDKRVRHIVIPGLISTVKGSGVLRDVSVYAEDHNLPLKFTVFGYTNIDKVLAELSNVTITGAYEEDQAIDLLLELDADILWFPSIWPETFSYTLSFAFQTGIYPVVFDIGAPADRLKKAGWGSVMPLETLFSPAEVCAKLLSLQIEPLTQSAIIYERGFQAYDKPLSNYYMIKP